MTVIERAAITLVVVQSLSLGFNFMFQKIHIELGQENLSLRRREFQFHMSHKDEILSATEAYEKGLKQGLIDAKLEKL